MKQRKVKPMDSIPEEKSETSFQGKFVSNKITPSKDSNGEKKPFNKKLWRTQKYSKKYKLQQWEEKRKKVVMKEYYRQIKDDVPKFDVQKIYEQDEAENDNENNLNADIKAGQNENNKSRNRKESSFKRKSVEEKFQARASYKEKQEEKIKAKNEYQERRKELMKKINKRTKKGQLCLNDRIELLYSEIKDKMEEEKGVGSRK